MCKPASVPIDPMADTKSDFVQWSPCLSSRNGSTGRHVVEHWITILGPFLLPISNFQDFWLRFEYIFFFVFVMYDGDVTSQLVILENLSLIGNSSLLISIQACLYMFWLPSISPLWLWGQFRGGMGCHSTAWIYMGRTPCHQHSKLGKENMFGVWDGRRCQLGPEASYC